MQFLNSQMFHKLKLHVALHELLFVPLEGFFCHQGRDTETIGNLLRNTLSSHFLIQPFLGEKCNFRISFKTPQSLKS
jgi:hypothetical protein